MLALRTLMHFRSLFAWLPWHHATLPQKIGGFSSPTLLSSSSRSAQYARPLPAAVTAGKIISYPIRSEACDRDGQIIGDFTTRHWPVGRQIGTSAEFAKLSSTALRAPGQLGNP